MTDYDYDNHRVTLDGSDRSKNNASDVAGYSITVTPQANWPGMSASKNKVRFHADQMNQVAQWLEDRANELADLPATVERNLANVKFGPDEWPAARAMGRANDDVKGAVSKYTTDLVANLKQAAASIRAAAKANQNSDDASATGSQHQSANL